jgi:hypothetical protein
VRKHLKALAYELTQIPGASTQSYGTHVTYTHTHTHAHTHAHTPNSGSASVGEAAVWGAGGAGGDLAQRDVFLYSMSDDKFDFLSFAPQALARALVS